MLQFTLFKVIGILINIYTNILTNTTIKTQNIPIVSKTFLMPLAFNPPYPNSMEATCYFISFPHTSHFSKTLYKWIHTRFIHIGSCRSSSLLFISE